MTCSTVNDLGHDTLLTLLSHCLFQRQLNQCPLRDHHAVLALYSTEDYSSLPKKNRCASFILGQCRNRVKYELCNSCKSAEQPSFSKFFSIIFCIQTPHHRPLSSSKGRSIGLLCTCTLCKVHSRNTLRNDSSLNADFYFVITAEMVWWVDPGGMPGAHQSCSITRLLPWTGETKYKKRLVGQDKEGQGDHSAITITGKTDLTWGKN